ncbi:hypothetical protein [uncultured Clostridium sp.]|uniref:hypothetical protein n=1 Tax=uncultured Clostridium sp. TaxID=59620 RepID=UPI002582DC3E|nr:hypothetical protein [uncultured Clostridium sp.]
MSKRELKQQVKDLCEVLNFCIDNMSGADKYIKTIINIAKIYPNAKWKLESMECMREIKKRKLTNEYIRKFDNLDIQEALKISKKEASKKIKDFDFTTKEKNIIMNTFKGCAKGFLLKHEKKAI